MGHFHEICFCYLCAAFIALHNLLNGWEMSELPELSEFCSKWLDCYDTLVFIMLFGDHANTS